MKNKLKHIIFLALVLIIYPINSYAKEDIKLFVDGNFVKSDVAPFIENNRTLVPVRIISENLGYNVTWNGEKQTVTISGNNKEILMPINSTKVTVDKKKKTLDVPAKVSNNRTFVPVRFIAENLGTTVDWDNKDKVVVVGKGYTKSTNSFEEAKVTRVVDGDTIIVNLNGKDEKLRMILVDTPETVHPKKPVEFYGKEASNFTKSKLTNKTVYLQKDVSDRDRYNRILRYVWLERPKSNNPTNEEIKKNMYNAILIKDGYGKIATFPPDIKYVELFKKLDRSAREQNLGMWSVEGENFTPEKNTSENKKEEAIKSNPNIESGKIKGNKNSKIYHLPNGANYNKISEKNIIYFNSEEEAINAGYRKSKN